jgi:iron complex transport system ATP-binding protein
VLLDGIDLEVTAGTWCTIIGPNGAGKTTLVTAMAGLRPYAEGSVYVDGVSIHELRERDRARRLAFVPQHPTVPVGMSVLDYVTLGRTASHGLLRAPSAADHSLVRDVLSRLGLDDLRYRDLASLSGGERQRVVLARTFAQGTSLVILDEPITGLDVRHQMEVLELLKKEVDECQLTVVATLHDLTLAGHFADQLVLLDHGLVRANGTSSDVLRSPALSEAYEMQLRVLSVDGADVIIPVR